MAEEVPAQLEDRENSLVAIFFQSHTYRHVRPNICPYGLIPLPFIVCILLVSGTKAFSSMPQLRRTLMMLLQSQNTSLRSD